MNTTITTIIPFYNSEKTLSTMLDSILGGTFVPSEILLIDDGSTDNSPEIAKAYEKDNSSIKYVHQDHSGVSAARNLGLSLATGYWISFLDADDYIEPDMYELMIKALYGSASSDSSYKKDSSYDGCICGYYTHVEELITPYAFDNSKVMSSSDILKAMFTDNNVRGFLVTRLFRAATIKKYSFDSSIGLCEDLLIQSQLFAENDLRYVCIPKPFYHYIQNSSSATSAKVFFKNNEFIYKPAFDKILSIVKEDYVKQSYNGTLEYCMYTQLISYKNGNRSKEALQQIRLLQKELKNTPCENKSKRRIAYQYAPILFSLVIH